MNTKTRLTCLIAVSLIYSQYLYAQQTATENSDDKKQEAATEEIEEVTVVGQRLISSLRMQAIRADDRAFDLFNELNDDDQYDIHCHQEAPTGTRIKYRQCAPNFYRWAEADMTSAQIGGIYTDLSAVVANKYKLLRDKMQETILENPELLDAFLESQELHQQLGETATTYWDRQARTP